MVLISRLCRFIRLGMGFRVWGIGIILAFGCSSHERDNPTDPIHVYKVTFNASEATGGTPPEAMTGSYGDVIQLPDGGSLERAEYAFGGWGVYSHTITGDTAMNAVWVPVYTVTFDGNGATSGTAPTAMKASSGSYILLPDGNLEKTGYVFGGWSTSSSYNRSVDGLYGYTVSNNTTFYANWIPFRTVFLEANGATSGAPPADLKVIDGSEVRYSDIGTGTMEKPGYVFGCWGSANQTTCYSYSAYSVVIYDIRLYAIWLPIYTVTFDGNGAISGTVPADMKAGSGLQIQLPDIGTLEKTDYLFTGWNTNSSGTGTIYNAGSSYTVAGDTTLYATWVFCPNSETHFCDTRDFQVYKITTIETENWTQTWFAENLNYDTTGSRCYDNCVKYGRLYDWSTAMGLQSYCNSSVCSSQILQSKDICPEGWHIPKDLDWERLSILQKTTNAQLKATSGWNDRDNGDSSNGTDDYGFSALPGGQGWSNGSFDNVGYYGFWWSSNEYSDRYGDNDGKSALRRYISYLDFLLENSYQNKSALLSIRCLKDE